MKIPTMRKTLFLLIGASASAFSVADIVVVGSSGLPELSAKEARQIFLKRSHTFRDGTPAIPIDLSDNYNIKWQFYEKVVGKERSQVYAYWTRASVGAKKTTQPEQVETVDDLKKHLKKTGAIGYIDAKYVEPGMNVLLTIPVENS